MILLMARSRGAQSFARVARVQLFCAGGSSQSIQLINPSTSILLSPRITSVRNRTCQQARGNKVVDRGPFVPLKHSRRRRGHKNHNNGRLIADLPDMAIVLGLCDSRTSASAYRYTSLTQNKASEIRSQLFIHPERPQASGSTGPNGKGPFDLRPPDARGETHRFRWRRTTNDREMTFIQFMSTLNRPPDERQVVQEVSAHGIYLPRSRAAG